MDALVSIFLCRISDLRERKPSARALDWREAFDGQVHVRIAS